jgi:hypothetical protein
MLIESSRSTLADSRRVHPPLSHPRPAQGLPPHLPNGLFASANRAKMIETAHKLLNLAQPSAEQTARPDPMQPLAQPCPCCGGRMFVIETFEAGC